MKIETLPQENHLFIQDLILESPIEARRLDAPFDPRLHIYEDDKEKVIEWFKEQKKEGILVKTLADLVIIDPSMRARLAVGENKNITDALATILVSALNVNDYETLFLVKMIQPKSTYKIARNERAWINLKRMYLMYYDAVSSSPTEMEEKIRYLCVARILFPERSTELLFDKSHIDWLCQVIDKDKSRKVWHAYAEDLGLLRLVSEERFLKERVIGTNNWEGIHRELEKYRVAGDWEVFTEFAANLTLIIAERLVITDDQFEVVLPELTVKLSPSQRKLPVIRDF